MSPRPELGVNIGVIPLAFPTKPRKNLPPLFESEDCFPRPAYGPANSNPFDPTMVEETPVHS